MLQLINMPLVDEVLKEYQDSNQLEEVCRRYGCQGIEAIWGGEDCEFSLDRKLIRGWHLAFFCDWVDLWNNNEIQLMHKFKSKKSWEMFYGGPNREALIKLLSEDLDRAQQSGAEYVVFHVSDVSVEEVYTYQWLHSDEEVVDRTAELINLLMDGKKYTFKLLLENLHWAGFTFTKPDITKRMLKNIHYQNKGIMLDLGHLMCTNLELQSQEEAIDYIHKMLDEHGILCRYIKGVHLHQSVSGEYTKEHLCIVPKLPEDYLEKFAVSYQHILNIDTHQPVTHPGIQSLIERIAPEYLVHELASSGRADKERVLKIQTEALGWKG
ncbi:TIM barrel protein [Aminipila butyrica]|uniref:TIM barrel protein n=2 Tax=Aminipila butyrica TaxID=433296 RepID=A0A858BXQ5_9FIRM|nr:TIM barrel protein [Aminipila butyrica]